MARNSGAFGGGGNRNQGNKNKSRNRGGGKLCPQCGQRQVPQGRQACYVCRPEHEVLASMSVVGANAEILVETLKNTQHEALTFAWRVEGGSWKQEKTSDGTGQDAKGIKTLTIPVGKKEAQFEARLVGSGAASVSLKIPAKKKKGDVKLPDTSSAPPEGDVIAVATMERSTTSVLVRTFRGGHLYPLNFWWMVEGGDIKTEKTADGKVKTELIGCRELKPGSADRERKLYYGLVGSKERKELVLRPKPTAFRMRPDDPTYLPPFSMTTSVLRGENEMLLFVQTYIDKRQEPCIFAYKVEGQDLVYDHTSDGVSSQPLFGHPAIDGKDAKGAKVIRFPFSSRQRELVVYLIGVEGDIEKTKHQKQLVIPAYVPPFKKTEPNKHLGFWANLRRAVKGE